jgi:DNA replication ATP-dependent helicase Dna2
MMSMNMDSEGTDRSAEHERAPATGGAPLLALDVCGTERGDDGALLVHARAEDGAELSFDVPPYYHGSGEVMRRMCAGRERDGGAAVRLHVAHAARSGNALVFPPRLEGLDAAPLLILEPHWLMNVTTLTQFDYCRRNYFTNRYAFRRPGDAMLRGTIVHEVFDRILADPGDARTLRREAEAALAAHALDLALLGVDPRAMLARCRHHLNALVLGARRTAAVSGVEAVLPERYVVSPRLGLKGKIDVILVRDGGRRRALELKTGSPWGMRVRPGHDMQVLAYHLLMRERGDSGLEDPMVVYSGEAARSLQAGDRPSRAPGALFLRVPVAPAAEVGLFEHRNILVGADHLSTLDFDRSINKCLGCVKNSRNDVACFRLHDLGLRGGEVTPALDAPLPVSTADIPLTPAARDFFDLHNRALVAEYAAVKREHGLFLGLPAEQRIALGRCVPVQTAGDAVDGLLPLACDGGNTSEFREGDPCLLSDARGPVHGECVEVFVAGVSNDRIVVRLPAGADAPLWFEPQYLDGNALETGFERNFAALYALFDEQAAHAPAFATLRAVLLDGARILPANDVADAGDDGAVIESGSGPALNDAQRRAVALACGMDRILLVQGPPGTGKTTAVAAMIGALHARGKRILVATYTHRAADELMRKLAAIAPGVSFLKLGQLDSVAAAHHGHVLVGRLSPSADDVPDMLYTRAREALRDTRVYIATTHAWMSGRFDTLADTAGGEPFFDTAIVDEASQVILTGMLGTMRLARKWVLVGDHQQLPPVLTAPDAAPLRRTLFQRLQEDVDAHPSTHVLLETQHRMPRVLADFISAQFYEGRLRTERADLNPGFAPAPGPLLHTLSDACRIAALHAPPSVGDRTAPHEVDVVRQVLRGLRDAGLPLAGAGESGRIGIIAPYRAQVAALRRMIEEETGNAADARAMVDTVDRYQGDERDVIILSTCLTDGDRDVPLLYQDSRRLNVALSRARAKLIVIGDLARMRRIDIFARLFTHMAEHPEECVLPDEPLFGS